MYYVVCSIVLQIQYTFIQSYAVTSIVRKSSKLQIKSLYRQSMREVKSVMKELKEKLQNIEGVGQRTNIAMITELYRYIVDAQAKGYTIKAIHEEISKVVSITLPSFKTTLQRVRGAIAKQRD